MYSGVAPLALAWLIAASAFTSASTTARWPFWAAMYSGVIPSASAWLTAAPAFTSTSTTAR